MGGESLWLATRALNILTSQFSISDLSILPTGQTHLESRGQESGEEEGGGGCCPQESLAGHSQEKNGSQHATGQ